MSIPAPLEALARQELSRADTLYIVAGSDDGQLLAALLARPLPHHTDYLFVEADTAAATRLGTRIPAQYRNRITTSTIDSWQEDAWRLDLPARAYQRQVVFSHSLSSRNSNDATQYPLGQRLATEVSQALWRFENETQHRVYIKQQLANAAENQTPAAILRGVFSRTNATAFVLGGGPSLDELLPWIIAQRDRGVIIAASRISARLLEAGVTPDIVICVDPTIASFLVSMDTLRLDPGKCLLVHSDYANPLLVGQWPGRNVFLGVRWPWQRRDDHDNIDQTPPTVTNSAVQLAIELGCRRIVLAGADFCFSREGHTHASGSMEHAAGTMLGQAEHEVVTNGGWVAQTNKSYLGAAIAMERQAGEAHARGIEIINPAAGAARLQHVGHIPTTRIILPEPLTQTASQMLFGRLPPDTAKQRRIVMEEIRRELVRAIIDLDKIITQSNEALKHTRAAQYENIETEYTPHRHKLDQIEKQLNKQFGPLCDSIKTYNAAEFIHFLGAARSKSESARLESYYRALKNGATQMCAGLKSAEARLDTRLEEEASYPDFSRLLRQWAYLDQHCGRAVVWHYRHPQAFEQLDESTRRQLTELELNFFEYLKMSATSAQAFFTGEAVSHAVLTNIIKRAQSLFMAGKQDDLERLAHGLSHYDIQAYAPILELIRGYLQELDGKTEDALPIYRQAATAASLPELCQAALERQLDIALKRENYPAALVVLKTLSQHAVVYRPIYADLLKATGDVKQSIDVYTDYITENPGDNNALHALGMLFAEIGVKDGVEAALTRLRTQAPTHPGITELETALKE